MTTTAPRRPPARLRARARRRPGLLRPRVPRRPTRRSASTPAPARSAAWPCPTDRPTSRAAAACSARCRAPSSRPRSACSTPRSSCPCVELGWTKTDAATICQARTDGAVGQLRRILGDEPDGLDRVNELLARAVEPLRPEGRSLYAGIASLGIPDDPLTAMWRRGDMLREYRGDSHIAAWVSAELDATEIGLLTELYWGLPLRSYSRTRAWTDEQFDAATERLESRGLIARRCVHRRRPGAARGHRGRTPTSRCGRRSTPSATTPTSCSRCSRPWGEAIRAAKGYPASGPHDLARATAASRDGSGSMIVTDDHLDRRRCGRVRRGRPAGTPSPRVCAGARCACRPRGRSATTARSTSTVAAARLGMPVVRDDDHGVTADRARLDDRAHAEHGGRARPRADRSRRRPVPAVLAARPQGAARRLGQLLRLPHEPARVAGTARRARAPRPHGRHRRPRHRAASTPTSGSTPRRRRTPA